jgi:hypothetical protein
MPAWELQTHVERQLNPIAFGLPFPNPYLEV